MGNDRTFTAKEIAEIMGISKQAVMARANKENWPCIVEGGNGGKTKKYPLSALPSDVQSSILIYIKDTNKENSPAAKGRMMDLLPMVSAAAADKVLESMAPENPFTKYGLPADYGNMLARVKRPSTYDKDSVGPADFNNEKFRQRLTILSAIEKMPFDWQFGRRKWMESVARKYQVSWQYCYKLAKNKEDKGLAGLRHTKSYKNQARVWTPEAIDYYCGLKLKRAHRKMDGKTIYNELIIEADRRGWVIGSYESANWWYKRKVSPLMEAYSEGGLRALDNLLPPIFRDYSDLAPMEMLVGDQHRFDFWAIDDDTLQLVRPECYLWVDLRTRLMYGIAVDRRYDAHLMAQALKHGLTSWGAFGSIFTDNGRPELSKHIISILSTIRSLGMEWAQTIDVPIDILDYDGDEVQPCVIMPGTHKKAVVKNAKSKLIERAFQEVERALVNHLKLPGYTKNLRGDINAQEIDEDEVERLHEKGQLLYLSEFAGAAMEACYHVNQQHHRGLVREWIWNKKPAVVSPLACLAACCKDGWRPRFLTETAIDNLLLKREKRIVNKGRIAYQNDFYEHDELIHLHGQEVTICCPDPIGEDVLLVYAGARHLCTALPISYSSMKDMDLARQKIIQKRERRKKISDGVRSLTSGIPDMRQYPESNFEKQAAAISADSRRRAIELKAESRVLTQEETDEGQRQLEELNRIPAKTNAVAVPPRPANWVRDSDRHDWCIRASAAGIITDEDRTWMEQHEAKMTPEARDRWQFEREYLAQEAAQ
jgi:putative transposase